MQASENKIKKIMLSGGGTGGSVTPLLVLVKKLRQKNEALDIVFVGTENGPEKSWYYHIHCQARQLLF